MILHMSNPELTREQRRETVFEERWRLIKEGRLEPFHKNPRIYPVFVSEEHEIMAFVDPFGKFNDHIVAAPARGNFGVRTYFNQLPTHRQLQLHAVIGAVGAVMLERHGSDNVVAKVPEQQSPVAHTEGNGVQDHAHTSIFAGFRSEGSRLYNAEPTLVVPEPDLSTEALAATQEYYADMLASYNVEEQLSNLQENATSLQLRRI